MWSARCGVRWPDHCCLWCLLFTLPLALLLGAFAALYGPGLISGLAARKMAAQQLVTRDSPNLAHFVNSTVGSTAYRHFYVFDLVNAAGVLQGEKPSVREVGPFVFKYVRFRNDPQWHDDDDTLSYYATEHSEFDPEGTSLSVCLCLSLSLCLSV